MAESVLNKLIKIDLDPQLLIASKIRRSRFPVSSLDISKSTRRIWSAWVSVWKTSNPI